MSASVHAGIHPPEQTPPWEQTHPPEQTPPPPGADTPLLAQCMLGDTGNKRAVCILLECILVSLAATYSLFLHTITLRQNAFCTVIMIDP